MKGIGTIRIVKATSDCNTRSRRHSRGTVKDRPDRLAEKATSEPLAGGAAGIRRPARPKGDKETQALPVAVTLASLAGSHVMTTGDGPARSHSRPAQQMTLCSTVLSPPTETAAHQGINRPCIFFALTFERFGRLVLHTVTLALDHAGRSGHVGDTYVCGRTRTSVAVQHSSPRFRTVRRLFTFRTSRSSERQAPIRRPSTAKPSSDADAELSAPVTLNEPRAKTAAVSTAEAQRKVTISLIAFSGLPGASPSRGADRYSNPTTGADHTARLDVGHHIHLLPHRGRLLAGSLAIDQRRISAVGRSPPPRRRGRAGAANAIRGRIPG